MFNTLKLLGKRGSVKHRKTRSECKSTHIPSQAIQRQEKVSSSPDNMYSCCF